MKQTHLPYLTKLVWLCVAGMFRCGPASVKAVQDKQLNAAFDVPFVYAEMNAEVHTFIMSNHQSFQVDTDSDRVGALICTKSLGTSLPQDITASYKAQEGDIRGWDCAVLSCMAVQRFHLLL